MADSSQCLQGIESTIVCVNINWEVSDHSLEKRENISYKHQWSNNDIEA
jgi:hypothetical protein